MSSFHIEMHPSLPFKREPLGTVDLNGLDWGEILKVIPDEYEIIYYIEGEQFRYYPASIATALNDLLLEWDCIRRRASHRMSLSGYTVLEMAFDEEGVCFFDPIARVRDPGVSPLATPIPIAVVEDIFREVIERVLGLVKQAARKP
jgi:hypothetical protein